MREKVSREPDTSFQVIFWLWRLCQGHHDSVVYVYQGPYILASVNGMGIYPRTSLSKFTFSIYEAIGCTVVLCIVSIFFCWWIFSFVNMSCFIDCFPHLMVFTPLEHRLNISTRGVFVFVLTILFRYAAAAAAAKSCQSYVTLCNPSDGSPPGSSAPVILQAGTLEWVSISFSIACMHAKSLQPCPTLCNPIDGSPPGSSVPGFLQARILEWVAISFSTF